MLVIFIKTSEVGGVRGDEGVRSLDVLFLKARSLRSEPDMKKC